MIGKVQTQKEIDSELSDAIKDGGRTKYVCLKEYAQS
jgi:hypothetical protein